MTHYRQDHHGPRRRIGAALLVVVACLLAIGAIGAYFAVGGGSGKGPSARPPEVADVHGSTPVASRPGSPSGSPVAAPFSGGETAAWVAAENAKPGTTSWHITKLATDHQIDGYTGEVSVNVGQPAQLYVSTTAPTWGVSAYRMGWYGGDMGRLLWSQEGIAGVAQPACPLIAATRTVSCNWQNPLTVSTAGWPQGTYLFKLQSSTGWQSYVPLTIRDDASHSAYLVNDSVTTWQAYNTYGGYSLYQGPTGALADRAYAVSFDRPYAAKESDGLGAADFLGLELPMIAMMESHSLDVSYTTDVNVAENPALLEQHKAFISLGHDEYYSLSMFNGLTAARDAGVNLVFLGANAVYRHIRLAPTALGRDRLEIDYKNPNLDPLYGKDNADVTPWAWRSPPNDRPESALLGEMWQCNPVHADMVITDPSSWVMAGTGLTGGSRIANIIGPEYDHFSPNVPNPGDVTVLASSPVDCNGRHSTADMTYYSEPGSKAGVWDTGTIDFVGQVTASCPTCAAPNAVTRMTDNVLAAFGTGPAGVAHPSKANMGGAPPTPTTTVPATTGGTG